MPKRSLSVRSLRFRQKHKKPENAEKYAPSDLDGCNLIDLFEEWVRQPDVIPLMDEQSNECVKIKNVVRMTDSFLLIDTLTGKRGEEGELYDPEEDEPVFHISEDQAPTGHTRACLYVPDRGEVALFFSEHCQRGSSGYRLIRSFASHYSRYSSSIKLDIETVIEGSDWLDHIQAIRDVEVKVYSLPSDASKLLNAQEGIVSVSIKPQRNKRFSAGLLGALRSEVAKPGTIIGFPELDDLGESKILATVEGDDGRSKKIDVMQENTVPKFYRTLSENGEPELTDDQLLEKCLEYADEIFSSLGQR